MAKLAALGEEYLAAAAALRARAAQRRREAETAGGETGRRARREAALLEAMVRQTQEVGELAEHYYDPGYWRSGRYCQ